MFDEEIKDTLVELVLSPPSPAAAKELIGYTGTLHIAALTGLLQRIQDQHGLELGYKTIDAHLDALKEQLHESMYVIAKAYDLKAKGISDVNLATRLDIEVELEKANRS